MAQSLWKQLHLRMKGLQDNFSKNGRKIRSVVQKGMFLALAMLFLAGAGTGCYKIPDIEILETRPLAEIQETGITPEDVLAAYDGCAKRFFQLYFEEAQDKMGDIYDSTITQFHSLSVPQEYCLVDLENSTRAFQDSAFYICLEEFGGKPHPWIRENPSYYDVYSTAFFFSYYSSEGSGVEHLSRVFIPASDFDALMDAFGNEKVVLTEELLSEMGPLVYGSYRVYTGLDAYPAMTITREDVLNATPEQLWVLYNVLNEAIIPFNAEKELPDHPNVGK